MTTPVFICGAECGIAVLGTASAGTEHWSALSGTPSIVTSGPGTMRSTRCFRFNSAATSTKQTLTTVFATAIAAPATVVARFYIYFATLPTVNTLMFLDSTAGTVGCVQFISSDATIRASTNNTALFGATGVVVTTGQWYRIDYKAVKNTTMTVDVNVDGVACGQYSQASSSATVTGFEFGAFPAASLTADIYIDDMVVSGTSADYPIGVGTVAGLYPNGDKTNNAATPTDGNGGHLYTLVTSFGKGSAGGTNVGAQNAESTSWQSLQNPLSSSIGTNFITEKVAGAGTQHMVWTHDALPAALSVNGVMLVGTTHSATAVANTQSMTVTDSAGANGLQAWNLLDLSESTITIPTSTMATKPGGGAWTKATVDSCLIRWGDSNDVSPTPNLDGVVLEVDYVPFKPSSLFIPLRQATRRASVW